METSVLEDLGLSKGEIKVYLTLLEIGSTKVGIIIEKSNMASSAVHNSINSLIQKGLISYIKRGKIKYYEAVPPKQLVIYLEDKKKKILEILPELEEKHRFSNLKEEAEVFETLKGVTSMLNILIEYTKKGDDYYFFATSMLGYDEAIQKFFEKYDIKRQEKGLNIKGLAPKHLRYLFYKRKMLKMRYPNFPIPSDISICNDKIALISWSEKPVGYLIRSKQIVQNYKDYFNRVWNKV